MFGTAPVSSDIVVGLTVTIFLGTFDEFRSLDFRGPQIHRVSPGIFYFLPKATISLESGVNLHFPDLSNSTFTKDI